MIPGTTNVFEGPLPTALGRDTTWKPLGRKTLAVVPRSWKKAFVSVADDRLVAKRLALLPRSAFVKSVVQKFDPDRSAPWIEAVSYTHLTLPTNREV